MVVAHLHSCNSSRTVERNTAPPAISVTMGSRKPVNQIVKSPLSIEIPATDIASYVFTSGTSASRLSPQYFDAERPSRNFSLSEAEVCVKQFGKGLQKNGLREGDRVLLYSGNDLFFPVVLWGVTAAGGIFTAASPTASALELEYQLRDSDARFLLASPAGLSIATKAAEQAGLSASHIYVFGSSAADVAQTVKSRPWTELWCSKEEAQSWSWHRMTTLDEAKSTTAVLNYSSGTTGVPKGVELSHYNLVSNSEQVLSKRTVPATTALGKTREARLKDSGERWIAALPMYHAFGQTYASLTAARCGAKVFIMSKFTLEKYLQFLDVYRITFMTTVPTILNMLNKYQHRQRFNLNAIEVVTSGSAPLDASLAANTAQKFLRAGVQIKQGWGMTETTCSVCGFSPDDKDDGASIGWLNPNCAAKIVPVNAEEETPSAADADATVGEIWVAGPQMMKGYWHRPKETAETIVEQDGYRWVRTGDIGYIDHRGCLYIVDRLKVRLVRPNSKEYSLITMCRSSSKSKACKSHQQNCSYRS